MARMCRGGSFLKRSPWVPLLVKLCGLSFPLIGLWRVNWCFLHLFLPCSGDTFFVQIREDSAGKHTRVSKGGSVGFMEKRFKGSTYGRSPHLSAPQGTHFIFPGPPNPKENQPWGKIPAGQRNESWWRSECNSIICSQGGEAEELGGLFFP